MRVYTYSEARQKFSKVLEQAESTGKVLIRRKDGRTFALIPEKTAFSPLDVPSITTVITTKEIVEIVREGREGIGAPEKNKTFYIPLFHYAKIALEGFLAIRAGNPEDSFVAVAVAFE